MFAVEKAAPPTRGEAARLWLAEQRYVYFGRTQVAHMSESPQYWVCVCEWVFVRTCVSQPGTSDDGPSDDGLHGEDPPVSPEEEKKKTKKKK